jgi:hypothetical protein
VKDFSRIFMGFFEFRVFFINTTFMRPLEHKVKTFFVTK